MEYTTTYARPTFMAKRSQWIFGGDGWCEETSSGCFDSEAENKNIGFSGLDHVLASGENVCRRPRTPLNKDIEVNNEEKLAVECGYWHLWHFNPAEEDEGKNGFHLDSKEPDWSKFRDLATPTLLHFGNVQASLTLRSTSAAPIMGKVRYNSQMKTIPQEAEELFVATERNAKLRYKGYKKLSEM